MILLLLNFIIGFVIPWILGLYLLKKDAKLFITIFPFESMLAFSINVIGFNLDLWNLYPFKLQHLSGLPFDLGLYPIMAVFMIYLIKKGNHLLITILAITFFTTIEEYCGILIDRITYEHGWNIFYTFLSYLLPYVLTYVYYLIQKQYKSVD